MAKYKVEYKHELTQNFTVEAETEEEAKSLVELAVNTGEIPIDYMLGQITFENKGLAQESDHLDISASYAESLKNEYPDDYEDILKWNTESEEER